jgi:hypothetical protein
MTRNSRSPGVGKEEPDLRLDLGTIMCTFLGGACSWINMLIIHHYQVHAISEQVKIYAYLSIIFTTIIPGVAIAYKNRYWGYGYMIGFAAAGLPFMIFGDPFIGGYTFFTALFIFIILWLIFWKAWRSLSGIKTVER